MPTARRFLEQQPEGCATGRDLQRWSRAIESGIFADFGPGGYIAVLTGVNGAGGIALGEAYHLQ